MGRAGKLLGPIKYLTFEEVVEINRRMVLTYGGFFAEGNNNLANPGSLAYIVAAIRGSFFGQDLYPTLVEKAAALAWKIITTHVFYDGNKRTGIEACRLMLDLNGYTMKIDREVIEVTVQICEGRISFPDFVQWVRSKITPKPPYV